ncbi:WhiB family transcriptional regulator [Streptomyces sp. NPDC093272]|uniref:WhiB family transcriptional regulator n=1 Tax=Streptomyces sp. NPDC093272 TaxID=3154981 RepID=UPI00343F7DA9
MSDALCAQADPDTWVDLQPGTGSRQPKRICGDCPVRAECDRHADAIRAFDGATPVGVWGGIGPRQRKQRRRLGEAA